jgi:hypothetical protein
MDEEIRRLRAEAQRLTQGKHRTQVRYPDAFRHAAVALARTCLGRGGAVARVARELGVSEPTLTKWLRPAAPVLRPVTVTAHAAPAVHRPVTSPVLITPHGVRVEGLDRETLVVVLRALG